MEWKNLFSTPEYATIILDSLAWLQQQKQILLFAFVLMPSHLHIIVKPEKDTIGEILQQFGSFTAHEILKKLRKDDRQGLINVFHESKRDSRHEHSIWQDIQAKNIYSIDFLWQKMEYIHQNPMAKNWKLVKNRTDYAYSSAGYYDDGKKPVIRITDINKWLTLNPSAEDGGKSDK